MFNLAPVRPLSFIKFSLAAGVLAGWCLLPADSQAANQQGGGAFSSKPKKQKVKRNAKPAKKSRTKRSISRKALRGCVRISVSVPRTKSDGRLWDVKGKNNQQAPDIFIKNTSSGKISPTCKNTFRCGWKIRTASNSVSLSVIDRDILEHDLIGRGRCSLSSRNCRLGRARVRLSGC